MEYFYEFLLTKVLKRFQKRSIRSQESILNKNKEKDKLRSANEYENLSYQKTYDQNYSTILNIYDYLSIFQKITGENIIQTGIGLLAMTKKYNYKNFLDIGTGEGIIPIILGMNKKVSVLGTDYNSKQIDFLRNKINIKNVTFALDNLFDSNLESFKNVDVLLMNGIEAVLNDDDIIRINNAAVKYKIKQIWITSNHIFEWNFKKNKSYIYNIFYLIFNQEKFKKGRLIGFYRSLSWLKFLFKGYKLIEHKNDFNSSGRHLIQFQKR